MIHNFKIGDIVIGLKGMFDDQIETKFPAKVTRVVDDHWLYTDSKYEQKGYHFNFWRYANPVEVAQYRIKNESSNNR